MIASRALYLMASLYLSPPACPPSFCLPWSPSHHSPPRCGPAMQLNLRRRARSCLRAFAPAVSSSQGSSSQGSLLPGNLLLDCGSRFEEVAQSPRPSLWAAGKGRWWWWWWCVVQVTLGTALVVRKWSPPGSLQSPCGVTTPSIWLSCTLGIWEMEWLILSSIYWAPCVCSDLGVDL